MKNKILNIGLTAFLGFMFLIPNAHAAKFGLNPSSGQLRAGCRNTVNIILNTEGADSNSADAFLKYNPKEIEVLGINDGTVYQAYPGKVINNGTIMLTAFNDVGAFNGRGVLASISFRSKPGVKSTSIKFNYSQGSTTDSNIASPEAVDLLNGAYGASYTFVNGSCSTDRTAPWIENEFPKDKSMNIPIDSEISFLIKDNQSGIDINKLKVQINDDIYKKDGKLAFRAEKRGLAYKITIKHVKPFGVHEPVHVTIKASDADGNRMNDYTYGFNEFIAVGSCLTQKEGLRGSAQSGGGGNGLMVSFIILFLISAFINVLMWFSDHPHIESIHIKKHKIKIGQQKRK